MMMYEENFHGIIKRV